jgi:hypothetical protein
MPMRDPSKLPASPKQWCFSFFCTPVILKNHARPNLSAPLHFVLPWKPYEALQH